MASSYRFGLFDRFDFVAPRPDGFRDGCCPPGLVFQSFLAKIHKPMSWKLREAFHMALIFPCVAYRHDYSSGDLWFNLLSYFLS